MAPKRGQSIERTDEYDAFLAKLAEYHEKRGTTLETDPKVGLRHVDLYKLYNRVLEEGGYDLVSDTKAKPLMWRGFAEEFVGKTQYSAAQAFQIKNVYYKNLCAYEISTHWKQEPPPREILEDVTAKGGSVMTRTLENFARPNAREQENLQNGDASDASPEQKTPNKDQSEPAEEPGSGTGRTTRGLRQQPPQRVLFQPDASAGRHARGQMQTSHTSPTPTSGANGVTPTPSVMNGTSSTLASYEPPQVYPLSLKPVTTPANNPEHYRIERKRKLEFSAGPLAKKYRNIMLPGTGFVGPNIYMRALHALQSGVPDEEQYALHHLVKISCERGDKYRFDGFPGLADTLLKKVLQVTGLFYDVDWEVVYDDNLSIADDETLNGLHCTPDIHQRLASRMLIISDDSILDAAFSSQLNRVTQAGLILRNMCLEYDNAQTLARVPLVQDMLAVVLNLPRHACIVELRHYALEIAEQVLRHVDIGTRDALFHGLLYQTFDTDRGAIVTAFRTISRIAMNLRMPKRLDDIPPSVLRRAQEYLLIDDEELRSACLDLLTQYTDFSENVENLLQCLDAEALAQQLSRLVLSTAREVKEQRKTIRPPREDDTLKPPRLNKSVVDTIMSLDEPERSSEWLRMCFVADPDAEMTQISLWQAYQATFAHYQATHPHLVAGEFIKNVSNTFQGAAAQVAGSNKYVIRGIRSRKAPVDAGSFAGARGADKSKELHCCHWRTMGLVDGTRDPVTGLYSHPTEKEDACGEWFRSGNDMLRHILGSHLHLSVKSPPAIPDGDKMDLDLNPSRPSSTLSNGASNGTSGHSHKFAFDYEAADQHVLPCRWAGCTRSSTDFASGTISCTKLLARHIATHLPDTDSSRLRITIKGDPSHGVEYLKLEMLTDERGEATGVPLRAAIVLRNLARFMPKHFDLGDARGAHRGDDKADPMATVFNSETRERLYFAMSHSKVMRECIGTVFQAIRRSENPV